MGNSLSNLEKRPKINTVPDRISPNSGSEAGEQASNALRAECMETTVKGAREATSIFFRLHPHLDNLKEGIARESGFRSLGIGLGI